MWLSVMLLVLLLFMTLLLAVFHYTTNGRKYWFFRNVPYREPCPIFGNFGATFLMRRSYTKMLQFYYENYRNEKYVGIFQARRPTLMVIDIDLVKNILSKEFPNFSDRVSVATDTKREPLLRNLANMSGSDWKAMRQIVTPTFSSAKMRAMFPLIADCAQVLKDTLKADLLDEVNVPNIVTRFTTDVIGSCAFGFNPGSLKNPDSPFLRMSQKMFKIDRATLLKRYCRTFFPRLFKFLNLKSYSLDVELFFTSIINKVLEERRSTGFQRHDFLQLMLNVQKTESSFIMTDSLITSNSFIFMLAGLETSSTTLSFCLYELAKDKDLQDAVRNEILECTEKYGGLNYEAVGAMRFVTQSVLETLRLHPPTPLTTRLCTAPCQLNGTDLNLKVRDAVLIPIHCIQRDPEYFPNPDKFDPYRFKDDLNPRGFLVFGDGPRACPGTRFAQLTVVAGLAAILSSYIVEPCSKTTPTIEYDPRSVMLKNKGSIWLKFTAVLECDVLEHLKNSNFLESCLDILVEFCNVQEYKLFIEPNISLSDLERRSEFEVRTQKSGDIRISPLRSQRIRPPPTAALVTAMADALHNISAFTRCPMREWNDRGLYRLLFRCASWSKGSKEENYKVQTAITRALSSVTLHKAVRMTLAGTKDCLHNFLATMTPLDIDENNTDCLLARKQSLLLLATLLPERAAAESVWRYLMEVSSDGLFRLLHQCLEIDETELQDAGLYCLTQLLQSTVNNGRADKSKDDSCISFYDNLKSPFNHENVRRYCSGDEETIDNCQPKYMAEEICKSLLILYHEICLETQKYQSVQDDRWVLVSSCLCSVMAGSARSRAYAVHRCTPRSLLDSLRAVRDHLFMTGKPADVIRNANHNPVLRTLYWLLTMINCMMVECQPAKESCAEDSIAASLNKLWPWCMMTDQLRQAVMNLLHTFTNDCPKAWAAMCACVGGRSLVLECCALTSREAARTTHSNDHTLLYLGINTLRHCMSHHHCRTIILKSEVLGNMYKMCVRERSRAGLGAGAWVASVYEAAARHAEGAAAVLALVARGAVMALAPRARAAMMPAIAHAAHHHRVTFLQSPELLEFLSGTLLTGDTGEVISAARAVWALAANNHKAKLLLRSAGVAAAVHSALQKLQRSPTEPTSQRALQLLTYTNTVLQTT